MKSKCCKANVDIYSNIEHISIDEVKLSHNEFRCCQCGLPCIVEGLEPKYMNEQTREKGDNDDTK